MRLVLERLQQEDHTLTRDELDGVATLAMESCTVSLREDSLMEQFSWLTLESAKEIKSVAGRVQAHSCGDQCTRNPPDGQECSLYFPRLPSHVTLVSRLPDFQRLKDRRSFLEPLESLQCRVQESLRELKRTNQLVTASISSLLHSVDPSLPQHNEDGSISWAGIRVTPGPDLTYLLERLQGLPGLTEGEVLRTVCWQWCLQFRQHPRVILTRTVQESYTATYSPTILLSTRSNHEIEVITSSPSKVFAYMSKGSAASSDLGLKRVVRELEDRGEEEIAAEVERLKDIFKLRQVPLMEAMYRLNGTLGLSSSNVSVTFKTFKHEDDTNNNITEYEEYLEDTENNDNIEDVNSEDGEDSQRSYKDEEAETMDYSWR